jgi:hypothetical protein
MIRRLALPLAALLLQAATASLLGGCTSVSAAVPDARALTADERDTAPLRAGPDEFVVDGLVIDTSVVPRIDVAIGPSGDVLAAWMDGPSHRPHRTLAALVRAGSPRISELDSFGDTNWSGVHVGFGADGSGVVAWDGWYAPQSAGACVLAPGAAEWSEVRRFGADGAKLVALDSSDARRSTSRASSSRRSARNSGS